MKTFLFTMLLALTAWAETIALPQREYDRIRDAEQTRDDAIQVARSTPASNPDHACLQKIAALAIQHYRRVFKQIAAKHPGYMLNPELLTLNRP